jgi:S-DNA-T family DNA segregation ATPase FtsK/SpoIIIE
LWGIAGGLAPAVHAGLVELWGIDLKRGVEIEMGRPLFAHVAYSVDDALTVLRSLLAVIDARGTAMAGVSRLHEPAPGDPMHVLVIDELAALTAYADSKTKTEANRLLAEVLTQGRALGVVVVACVQDPRKETVGARGLFSQTVALRLRDASETRMVLGDGMAAAAPAHRIAPTAQGTAWVVTDDGHADRVRAAYWPDDLVRHVAATHAPATTGLSLVKTDDSNELEGAA